MENQTENKTSEVENGDLQNQDQEAQTQEVDNQEEQKTVDQKAYEKVKADMIKYKKEAQEYKSKIQQEEERRLRESNDWKSLYERTKSELEERDSKLTAQEQSFLNEKKFSAIREVAMKAGIRTEAISDLELLSFEDVDVVKTETGRVEVRGHDRAIEMLRSKKPHWFGKSSSNVNTNVPNVSKQGVVTEDELIKLSIKAQQTGDYSDYERKLKQFQKGV